MINTRGVRDWLRATRILFTSRSLALFRLFAPFLLSRSRSFPLLVLLLSHTLSVRHRSPTVPAVKVVKFKLPRARRLDG